MPFPLVPPRCSGGFVLPLALSTAAVLLLSSLSLQTLAMHGRQRSRQLFTTAEQADARQSVAMDFLQRASGSNRCLLAVSSSQWGNAALCPGADPQRLQAGLSDALAWQLSRWEPQSLASGTLQWRWPDASPAQLELVLPQ
ncbi:hypothetical protein N8506_03760 [Synechococcus sp. AH-601-N23]|nr:hypothetical protein [Synechococcus sp. AH-601-N23]